MGSFRDKLSEIFSMGKKEKPIDTSLEGWGLKVIADRKLKQRLEALQAFFDELNAPIDTDDVLEYLKELRKRQLMMNRCIHSLAVPYYRAGSSVQFREIMEGWQLEHSLALYWLDAVKDQIKQFQEEEKQDGGELMEVTTIDIETKVRRIHTVLSLHIWQDGQLVLAESYQNLDVSGSGATIIKTVPSHGGIDLSTPVSETV